MYEDYLTQDGQRMGLREKYGWEKSFERNVGYSVQDFYTLFETFLVNHADDENFDWLSSFSLID